MITCLFRFRFMSICLAICLFHPVSPILAIEVKQQLEARFSYRVNWDFEEGETKYSGNLAVHARGILKINEQFSSTSHDLPAVMIPYFIESMGGQFNYEEYVYDKNPPKGCPSLTEEFKGSGPFTVEKMPGPGNLIINNLGTMMKNAGVTGPAAAAMSKNMFDHYILAFPGTKQKIKGRRLLNCEYAPAEKTIAISNIGIRYLVPEDGRIDGQTSWTTKAEATPDFQVRVSNLPEHFEKDAFKPEKKPGGVRYQLGWMVKEPVFISIQRKVKGKWHDVETDTSLTETAAGERMILRGLVSPENKTATAIKWFIDDNNGKNYIKEFKADDSNGKPMPMTDDDLKGEEVSFVWYKGSDGNIRYQATVDEDSYDKEVSFSIEKPEYTVTWENSDDSHFGECVSGNADLLNKWPPQNRNTSHGYGGNLAPGKKVYGLEYNGILFQCSTESDIHGKTQWVQIIEETQTMHDFAAWNAPSTKKGLDRKYPTAYNDSYYDAPAIPTSIVGDKDVQSWHVIMNFDLFLMFRPDGRTKTETEQNEWIPVTLVKWYWEGKTKRDAPEGDWYEEASIEPVKAQGKEPTQEKKSQYPTWEMNSAQF